jgi:copper chaperone CopZ
MRTIAFVGLTLLLLAPPALSAADAGELPAGQARAVVPVSGLTCGDCCAKVEAAVAKIDGVVDVKADYEEGIATVTYEKDKVDVKQIVETINTKTSFKAAARQPS